MDGPIIFFDGYCALCNGFVDFVQARDRMGRFRFAPLQGLTFAARIANLSAKVTGTLPDQGTARIPDQGRAATPDQPEQMGTGIDWTRSIVLSDSRGLHRKSDAAIRVLAGLGGPWRFCTVLRSCPRPLRDLVYDFIARNRYRWFGTRETCRLPSESEAGRFLP